MANQYTSKHYPSRQKFAIFSTKVSDFIQIMRPSTRWWTMFHVDIERIIKMAADCSWWTGSGWIRWNGIPMNVETVAHMIRIEQLQFNICPFILILFKISCEMETSIYIWMRHFVPSIYREFSWRKFLYVCACQSFCTWICVIDDNRFCRNSEQSC